MEVECTINLAEKDLERIKDMLLRRLFVQEKANYFTLGEFVLTLLEMPAEAKMIQNNSVEENLFYQNAGIEVAAFNSYIVVQTLSNSVGSKYLFPITAYIAEVLWNELKSEIFTQFNTHDDSLFHPFCLYSNGSAKYFTDQFSFLDQQEWIPSIKIDS